MDHENCNCPGCFTHLVTSRIHQDLTVLAGMDAICNDGKPDRRFDQIQGMVSDLERDIMAKLVQIDKDLLLGGDDED